MEFEKILKLDDESKIKLLRQIIENDVSYWKKISILLALDNNDNAMEFLDRIVDSKIQEMELFYNKFNIKPPVTASDSLTAMMKEKNFTGIMKTLIGKEESNAQFKIAATQTLEILKHIPEDYYKKINPNFLDTLKNSVDENYIFEIDDDISIFDLELLEETKDLLDLISDKFWKTENTQVYIEDIFNRK